MAIRRAPGYKPGALSASATTISLNLPPMLIGGTGKHKIIVALAQNNYVLYRTPTASITITAK